MPVRRRRIERRSGADGEDRHVRYADRHFVHAVQLLGRERKLQQRAVGECRTRNRPQPRLRVLHLRGDHARRPIPLELATPIGAVLLRGVSIEFFIRRVRRLVQQRGERWTWRSESTEGLPYCGIPMAPAYSSSLTIFTSGMRSRRLGTLTVLV